MRIVPNRDWLLGCSPAIVRATPPPSRRTAGVRLFEGGTGRAVAHTRKKRTDLLESKCLCRSLYLESREEILVMSARTLQAAADLSWLEGSTGTQQEQQRLRLVAEGLGRDARAAKLLPLVVEYQRRAMKPTWQRPRLADWHRLVAQARRVLPRS